MRILALHGMGTSGPIFESQTASFRALLPRNAHTFSFPSAPFPSSPAPGIDVIFPPSAGFDYHAFFPRHAAQSVRAACHWLDEFLEDHGPFDVVMCFSQGCALLSAWIMYRAAEAAAAESRGAGHGGTETDTAAAAGNAGEEGRRNATGVAASSSSSSAAAAAGGGGGGGETRKARGATTCNPSSSSPLLPIRGAFFICGSLVLPVLEELGIPVSPEAKQLHERTSSLLKAKAGRIADIAASASAAGWTPGTGLWDNTDDLLHAAALHPATAAPSTALSSSASAPASAATMPPAAAAAAAAVDPSNMFGLDLSSFVEPGGTPLRIDIPTVHVYGGKDPRYPASIQLAHVCAREKRAMFDHGGGHDIPRSSAVSRRLVELMEWLDEEI